MPVPAGISLPMMMFSLRPSSESLRALDGGLGEHPGRLLEGGGRQPRVGGQRGLGDAHQLGTALGGLAALLDHLTVDLGEHPGVDPLAGQEVGVARLLDRDPARHLTHDELDVLVVDRHALVAVHLLDLVDEVLLGGADALDLEELLGIAGTLDDGVAGGDLLAVRRPRGDARGRSSRRPRRRRRRRRR